MTVAELTAVSDQFPCTGAFELMKADISKSSTSQETFVASHMQQQEKKSTVTTPKQTTNVCSVLR